MSKKEVKKKTNNTEDKKSDSIQVKAEDNKLNENINDLSNIGVTH